MGSAASQVIDTLSAEAAELRVRLQRAHGALHALRESPQLAALYDVEALIRDTRPTEDAGLSMLIERRDLRGRVWELDRAITAAVKVLTDIPAGPPPGSYVEGLEAECERLEADLVLALGKIEGVGVELATHTIFIGRVHAALGALDGETTLDAAKRVMAKVEVLETLQAPTPEEVETMNGGTHEDAPDQSRQPTGEIVGSPEQTHSSHVQMEQSPSRGGLTSPAASLVANLIEDGLDIGHETAGVNDRLDLAEYEAWRARVIAYLREWLKGTDAP